MNVFLQNGQFLVRPISNTNASSERRSKSTEIRVQRRGARPWREGQRRREIIEGRGTFMPSTISARPSKNGLDVHQAWWPGRTNLAAPVMAKSPAFDR